MAMKQILLVDDHMVIRKGLRSLLYEYDNLMEFHEAANGDEALAILKKNHVDLVIMDLQMGQSDSINLIELISIKHAQAYILVFSMLPEKIYARRVLKAGASGFLPKESKNEEIKKAFDNALNRRKYLSQQFIDLIARDPGAWSDNPFQELSHREFEIVNMLLTGNTITSISQYLNIRPSTVGTYKARIFQKLRVNSVFELKEMAVVHELMPRWP